MTATTRILVADDNADHALLALDAIAACGLAGIEVRVVAGGADVLRVVADERWVPHLLLLDVQMPFLDGFDVLERLKADEVGKLIPVVMLTSSADERDACRAYGLGTTHYVTKPVAVPALRELISRIPSYWAGVTAPADLEVSP
jgi:two-component system, response regulator